MLPYIAAASIYISSSHVWNVGNIHFLTLSENLTAE